MCTLSNRDFKKLSAEDIQSLFGDELPHEMGVLISKAQEAENRAKTAGNPKEEARFYAHAALYTAKINQRNKKQYSTVDFGATTVLEVEKEREVTAQFRELHGDKQVLAHIRDLRSNDIIFIVAIDRPHGAMIRETGPISSMAISNGSLICIARNAIWMIDEVFGSNFEPIWGGAITPGGTISIVAKNSDIVVTTLETCRAPWGSAITPDGTRVYITDELSHTVFIINNSENRQLAEFEAGYDASKDVVLNCFSIFY
jgi:YVTN family beta-propeller protein